MTADTTMTDVDTSKRAKEITSRLAIAEAAACSCDTKTAVPEHHDMFCHYRLFHEAGSCLLALSSRCDELERLAGDAERYRASVRSYFEKYAAGHMNSHELQPFREQFLDADKSLTEAFTAYQRKRKGE